MWVVGFLVAPTLFNVLGDRALAGELAGKIFSHTSAMGLICGGLLLLAMVTRSPGAALRSWRAGVLVAMIAITLVGEFVLAPQMQALKLAAGGAITPDLPQYAEFGRLHGISSTLFLVNSLLGLVLVLFGLAPGSER
jgi:hypothetical protein